jgi:hypothetical protein
MEKASSLIHAAVDTTPPEKQKAPVFTEAFVNSKLEFKIRTYIPRI